MGGGTTTVHGRKALEAYGARAQSCAMVHVSGSSAPSAKQDRKVRRTDASVTVEVARA
jgi:hypothetical protein